MSLELKRVPTPGKAGRVTPEGIPTAPKGKKWKKRGSLIAPETPVG